MCIAQGQGVSPAETVDDAGEVEEEVFRPAFPPAPDPLVPILCDWAMPLNRIRIYIPTG